MWEDVVSGKLDCYVLRCILLLHGSQRPTTCFFNYLRNSTSKIIDFHRLRSGLAISYSSYTRSGYDATPLSVLLCVCLRRSLCRSEHDVILYDSLQANEKHDSPSDDVRSSLPGSE